MYIVGTGLESIERVDISLEHVLSLAKPSKPKKDSWTGVPTHRDSPDNLIKELDRSPYPRTDTYIGGQDRIRA